jgi:hypothetical protein
MSLSLILPIYVLVTIISVLEYYENINSKVIQNTSMIGPFENLSPMMPFLHSKHYSVSPVYSD